MATGELSKFAGILSAALSQHHLSGFEIAQLECTQKDPASEIENNFTRLNPELIPSNES